MAKTGIKKTISVDTKFFENIFEKERVRLQKQLGIMNLSQPKFTKMIKGLKIIEPKKDTSNFKMRKKGNDFLNI
jgi:hypothetical protein